MFGECRVVKMWCVESSIESWCVQKSIVSTCDDRWFEKRVTKSNQTRKESGSAVGAIGNGGVSVGVRQESEQVQSDEKGECMSSQCDGQRCIVSRCSAREFTSLIRRERKMDQQSVRWATMVYLLVFDRRVTRPNVLAVGVWHDSYRVQSDEKGQRIKVSSIGNSGVSVGVRQEFEQVQSDEKGLKT